MMAVRNPSLARIIAAAAPAGPPPNITTSNDSDDDGSFIFWCSLGSGKFGFPHAAIKTIEKCAESDFKARVDSQRIGHPFV